MPPKKKKKNQSIPKLVNSQPRPQFRAFSFPNTVFHPPGIVRFTKESAGFKSQVNSQQKSDKIFKKSAQHLEIKRPSMPGALPRGLPTGPGAISAYTNAPTHASFGQFVRMRIDPPRRVLSFECP